MSLFDRIPGVAGDKKPEAIAGERIENCRNEITTVLLRLGERIYKLHVSGNGIGLDNILPEVKALDGLYARLGRLERSLREIAKTTAHQEKKGAKLPNNLGKVSKESSDEKEEHESFVKLAKKSGDLKLTRKGNDIFFYWVCPKCGGETSSGEKDCRTCGYKVDDLK